MQRLRQERPSRVKVSDLFRAQNTNAYSTVPGKEIVSVTLIALNSYIPFSTVSSYENKCDVLSGRGCNRSI